MQVWMLVLAFTASYPLYVSAQIFGGPPGIFQGPFAGPVEGPFTICYTQRDTIPAAYVPTSYTTIINPGCTATVTSTTVATVTPTTVTVTSHQTSIQVTTAPTSIATTILTETDVATTNVLSISTSVFSTFTIVTQTATKTISADAGWLPIQSSLPGAQYDTAGGLDPVVKRDELDKRQIINIFLSFINFEYPQSVVCRVFGPEECATTVTVTNSFTTNLPTPTSTVIVTDTSGFTFNPTSTTTTITHLTTTTTAIQISKTGTSTTSTSTVTTTTTLFAPCATNNFADSDSGLGPGLGFQSTKGGYTLVTAVQTATAYDCCVASLFHPLGPVAFGWSTKGDGTCWVGVLPTSGICIQSLNPSVAQSISGGDDLILGNSICGMVSSFHNTGQ